MNWIEQLLHVSPDHGSGMLEAAAGLIVALVPIVIAAGRSLRRIYDGGFAKRMMARKGTLCL